MNEELFKSVLKAHWRAANRAKQHAHYDSSNEQYWRGRIEVMQDIYFDLFNENLTKRYQEDTE